MPTTAYPSRASSPATTELSTPPDMATTTRVSDGGLGKPSEFSMVTGVGILAFRDVWPDMAAPRSRLNPILPPLRLDWGQSPTDTQRRHALR